MSGRLLFLLLSSPGVLGRCFIAPDADGHVTVPNGVQRLEEKAFKSCKTLVSITLPDGLTSLGDLAFYECTAIDYSDTLDDYVEGPVAATSAATGCAAVCWRYASEGPSSRPL